MEYAPMSRETHLRRGTCCDSGCAYCPWRVPTATPSRLVAESGSMSLMPDAMAIAASDPDAEMTLYSHQYSLVPVVQFLQVLTVIYRH